MSNEHELKCWPEYYGEVEAGRKTFEVRRDDRGFKVGDVLWLKEYEPQSQTYTGRSCRRTVSYITNFGQMSGMVVMALRSIPAEPVAWLWKEDMAEPPLMDPPDPSEADQYLPVYAHPPRPVSEPLSDERIQRLAREAIVPFFQTLSLVDYEALAGRVDDAIRTARRESGDAKDARLGVADTIIAGIISDIRDRRGIGDEWASIDVDTRNEIAQEWRKLINAALSGATHD